MTNDLFEASSRACDSFWLGSDKRRRNTTASSTASADRIRSARRNSSPSKDASARLMATHTTVPMSL